ELGDDAFPDPSQDEMIIGTSYQEVITNLPLVSEILTGLFLDVTSSGPGQSAQTCDRTLVDRIGYAARQELTAPNVSVDPSEPPIISPYDLTTISVMPSLQSPATVAPFALESANEFAVATADSSTTSQQIDALVAFADFELTGFLVNSDHFMSN